MPNSHMFGNVANSYARSAGMSASALPQVWSNNTAPAFQPFRSPQTKMFKPHHYEQSVSHTNGWNRFKPAESFHRQTHEEGFPEAFSVAENGRSEFSHDSCVSNSVLMPNREPISLHMWIIKPVPGSHNICVEGKKNFGEENFWHSDIVIERFDEKTVVTAAGSLYRLEGNMELMDAMAVGFSRSIVEAFWLGFPQDWKSLIEKHFQTNSGPSDTVYQPEAQDPDSEDDVSFVDNIDLDDTVTDDIDTKSTQSNTNEGSENYDEVDGADMECHVVENDDDIVLREASADLQLDVEEASEDKPVKDTKTTQANEKTTKNKMHVLSKWIIKFLADGKGIYVVGETENGSLWHSSAVEKRLSPRKLLSSSGSMYKLTGTMDKLLALNDGLPPELFNKFKNGFPKEWLEIIQEHIEGTHSQTETKKPTKTKQKVAKQHKNSSKTVTKSKDNTQETKPKKNESKSKSDKNVTPSSMKLNKSSSVNKGTKSRNRTTKSGTGHKNTEEREKFGARRLVITPRGQVVDLDNLGRSRSGRLIKPVLHSWVRQTVSMEGDSVVVHAPTTGASIFLKQFEDQYQNTSRKIQPYFNPRKKNMDYALLNNSKSRNSSMISNSMRGSASDSEKRMKNNDTVMKQPVVNSSNSDNLSTEDTVSADQTLVVAVTDILVNSRTKRNTSHKKRTTCYDVKTCEDGIATNNDRKGDAYDLDESCDRTLVDCVEIVDTDSESEDVRSRRTRQTSRKTSSHQRDTGSVHVDTCKHVTSKKTPRNFKTSPFTEYRPENAACTRRDSRKIKRRSSIEIEESVKDVSTRRSTRKSERLSGTGVEDVYESTAKNRRQTVTVKHRQENKAEVSVQGVAGKCSGVKGNSHKTRKAVLSDEETDEENGKCKERKETSRKTRVVILSDEETDEDCEMTVEKPVSTRSRRGSDMNSACRPRRSCSKAVPAAQLVTESETCDEDFPEPKKNKKNKGHRKKEEKTVKGEASDEEWTSEEKEKLYMACKSVPVNQSKYWEKVADKVQTKSAESCNKTFYHTEKNLKSVKKAKKDTKAKPKVTALTAGVGTLKRKKQLQEILKQHNENYEDDLFNSTPFRQTRKRKIPILNDLGDSLFEELARKQGRAFETPKGAGNIEGPDVPFASPEQTPGTHLNADMTDHSVDMDGYVHNMMKRRKKLKGMKRSKTISETPKPVRTNKSLSPSMKLFHKYLKENLSDKENHEDSENEEDYYWDEEAEEMAA